MTDGSAPGSSPESVHFSWVDVFSDRPLTGSPLPVVADADPLSDRTMRDIAREFNQPQTTFILLPTTQGADRRFRSFTPHGAEVTGPGHSVLGAWIWLAATGWLSSRRDGFVQQLGDRLTRVTITSRGTSRASVVAEQGAPRFIRTVLGGRTDAGAASTANGSTPDGVRGSLARALGLGAPAAILAAEVVATGVPHLLVRVADLAALDACAPDAGRLRECLAWAGARGCYVYAAGRDGAQGNGSPGAPAAGEGHVGAYARFFDPAAESAEEPATSTAACSLAALLVRDRLAPPGTPIRIAQGAALGRPSFIDVCVGTEGVAIGASGVVSAGGTLWLP